MKRNENFLLKDVGGEKLLVATGSQVKRMNGMITLNTTASFIWDLLSKDQQVDDLALALAEKFDVDFHKARADVEIFLHKIKQLDLVEP